MPDFVFEEEEIEPETEIEQGTENGQINEESPERFVFEEDVSTGIEGAPEYTPEQNKIVRDMLQLAAGREEANLFTNPITAIPALGNEILNLFGEGLPEAPTKVINTLGNLVGLDLEAKDERETSARLAGLLTSMSPGEIVQLVKEVPALGKYIVQLPQKLYKAIVNKSPELLSEANKIAEKFGLRKFRGFEEEAAPVNAVVSKKQQASLKEEVAKGSEEAIDRILDSKLPARTARKEGVDLEALYQQEVKIADESAAKIKEPVNVDSVINYLDDEIARLKSSAHSLSNEDNVKLRILQNERKNLSKPNPTKPSKDLITGKMSNPPPRIGKDNTGTQAIDQYRNFNENVKNIYRKAEFSGSEEIAKNTYEGIKKEWIKAIEKADPATGEALKKSNKIFHETANMERVENILSEVFSEGYNPGKLKKVLEQKGKGKFLERYLGEEAIGDLKDIAKYGKAAEKMILSQLKNPQTVMEMLGALTPFKMALILGKFVKTGGLFVAGTIAKAGLNRIQGAMFTSPTISNAYSRFIKAASGGNIGEFQKASALLSARIKEEFGSEEKLEKYANED